MNTDVQSGPGRSPGFGLRGLGRDHLDRIHAATLRVLGGTGIKVESKAAVELFHGGGARVEPKQGYALVKFPADLVEDCVRRAPGTLTFCGRSARDDHVMTPGKVTFSTFGGCIAVIDPYTRQHRRSTKKDCGLSALMCDAYDEIGVVERALCSLDMPTATETVHNTAAILANTSKHAFIAANSAANLRAMARVGAVAAGGADRFRQRPLFTVSVCPTSPLTLVEECCEVIMEAPRCGVGIWIVSMALSGGSAAASLGATLVTHNAEVLSALMLAQLSSPGVPCVYGSMSTVMDMRNGAASIGAPELAIHGAAAAQMARYYDLPSWIGGGLSDSKLPDAQAAYESALSALMGGLAGANVVYGAGVLDLGLTYDFAKFVMDLEMIRMVRHMLAGMAVSTESLCLDVIDEVGPGGEFLTHDHTYTHMQEQFISDLFDRNARNVWTAAGARDCTERAYEKARHILETYRPRALPAGTEDAMEEAIREYEKEIGVVSRS